MDLRPAAPGELTETERRVAELAAAGLTNREVAQRLFLSVKTVEANLARVYRKLATASRAELGARMRTRAPLTPRPAGQPPCRCRAWRPGRGFLPIPRRRARP